jgi:hypothetical protein
MVKNIYAELNLYLISINYKIVYRMDNCFKPLKEQITKI